MKITIPLAFALAHNEFYDRHKMLRAFRRQIIEKRLMTRIVKDLLKLFYSEESTKSIEADLQLWDLKQYVKSGINYVDS